MDKALLQAVLNNPGSDEPRLRLAKALSAAGDPMGELIELDIASVHGRLRSPSTPELVALKDRLQTLRNRLAPNAAASLKPYCTRYSMDRGFIDEIWINVSDFIKHGEAILSEYPIVMVHFGGPLGTGSSLFSMPLLSRLRGIALTGLKLVNADVVELAARPNVSGLRLLDISTNKLDEGALFAIATSPNLRSLRRLVFERNLIPSPVDRWIPTDTTELESYRDFTLAEGNRPLQEKLETTYGPLSWLHPPQEYFKDFNYTRMFFDDEQ